MAKESKQDKHTKSGLMKIGAAVVGTALVVVKLLAGSKENNNA